jgi:ABC-type bacteriocin/lantibiotic exporter with double-glycine peptidase domain
MILRYHRKPVTFGDVRQAIYEHRVETPTALHVVAAAEHFRLRGRGLGIDDPRQLVHLSTPSIAHMLVERGPFPRARHHGLDGFFAVVVAVTPHRVRWIDPYAGEIDEDRLEFLAHASGVFLVFDAAQPLPRARTRSVASS